MIEKYYISTERTKLDMDLIHRYLSTESYWCKGISFEIVQRAADNSLNFGVFYGDEQVGYARVVSDMATVAYLGDVFVVGAHRGKGLSKMLMRAIMQYPGLQGLRRWILLTRDAHELYQQYGWKPIASPDRWMEVHDPHVYVTPPVAPL